MISLMCEIPKPWILNPFIQSYTELTQLSVDYRHLKEIPASQFISAYEDQELVGIAFVAAAGQAETETETETESSLSVMILPSYHKRGIESSMLRLLKGKQSRGA
ncbi:GNAT family N-acetyltransferase [Paenibacillus lutrae]|uniref:GNAT family N-acetyltransferase n=1 Tax=Paenibacillus lutrae TaxID=2078573 RepID=A0A7X3FFQ9_9BACL|nr:GNAT family N-acetyltransferase [Paenibacillus lutrae]MVO98950.1 GNAT family N-acetyltransferase [Paenibacillus lutrae]